MRSIFFRIYIGVVLSVLMIFGLLFFSYGFINEYRLHRYLDSVAKGPFALITHGMARHQSAAREEWLGVIRRLTRMNLIIVDRGDYEFSTRESNRLDNGELVIRFGMENKSASLFASIPMEENVLLHAESFDVNEELSRVSALLVLNDLGLHSKDQRQQRLQEIEADFGFPLSLRKLEHVDLDTSQQRRIARGDIVVILHKAASNDPYVEVVAKYGNSGKLLVVGPIELFNWLPEKMILVLGFVALSVLAMCCYLFVHPLERKLELMATEVEKIGGDHIYSVHVKGNDAISDFSEKVSAMALRIKTLLSEQKELVYSISHELRTPVSRMKFRLDALIDQVESEKSISVVCGMEKDLDELNYLISEILTFAQLENGPKQCEYEDIDFGLFFYSIIEELSIQHSHISVDYSSSLLTQQVRGIRYLLKRVIQNLAINAVRYARSQVSINISVNSSNYILQVCDDGPGIPVDCRERIFLPFTRLDKSRDRSSGGFGLGLAIAQRVAQLHGGTIIVNDSALGGAEFLFQWPITNGAT